MEEYLDYLEYLELGQFRNVCDVLCKPYHLNHKNDVNNFYFIYPTSRGDSNLYPGNGPCKLQQCPRLLALSRLYLCEVVVRWMGYCLFIRLCFYLTVYLSQECLVVIGGWTGCILRIIFRFRIRQHEYNAYICNSRDQQCFQYFIRNSGSRVSDWKKFLAHDIQCEAGRRSWEARFSSHPTDQSQIMLLGVLCFETYVI